MTDMIEKDTIDSVLLLDQPDNNQWGSIVGAMKPGAHLLLFSDVKSHHLGTIEAEDNGLEVRDTIAYVFSDGENDAGIMLVTLARKPLDGNVAENVLKWGTGGLNIDSCRVNTEDNLNGGAYAKSGGRKDLPGAHRSDAAAGMLAPGKTVGQEFKQPQGRWPANLTHDNNPLITSMFPETGPAKSGGKAGWQDSYVGGKYKPIDRTGYDDNGGSASRFFYAAPCLNDLFTYLLKLTTPPNGTVLTNCDTGNLPNEYTYVTNCGQ